MIPLNYNIRSLAVRKTTTLTTVFGLALVVFVLATSQMLASGIRRTLSSSGSPQQALVLRKGATAETQSNISAQLVNMILDAPGLKRDAAGQPMGIAELVFIMVLQRRGGDGGVSNVTIRGLPDGGLAKHPDIHVIEGRAPTPGTDELMVGKQLVGRFEGLKLDEGFEIKKNRRVHVVGVFEAAGSSYESELIGDFDLIRTSFGLEGVVSSVRVTLQDPASFDKFLAAIENDKRLGLTAMREVDYYEKQSDGTVTLVIGLGAVVAFLFSIGATIGAMITMYAGVSRRKKEIGTLRALGFSRLTILLSFLLEGVIMALAGGALGAFAALCTRFLHFSLLNASSGSEISFSFDASPSIALTAVVVGSIMGVLGGILPAIQAARVSPTVAMRA